MRKKRSNRCLNSLLTPYVKILRKQLDLDLRNRFRNRCLEFPKRTWWEAEMEKIFPCTSFLFSSPFLTISIEKIITINVSGFAIGMKSSTVYQYSHSQLFRVPNIPILFQNPVSPILPSFLHGSHSFPFSPEAADFANPKRLQG